MNKLKLIFEILKIVMTFGPEVWKLAKEIYAYVESMSSVYKCTDKPLTSKEKAMKFDTRLMAKTASSSRPLTLEEAARIREAVWKVKNFDKIKTGKTPK